MKRAPLVIIFAMMLGSAFGADLSVVSVSAPAINCKFDNDCKIFVQDSTESSPIPGMSGTWFLQSRRWPIGEAGTAGAGLYAYLYRIDLSNLVCVPRRCVTELSLDFGPVRKMDYNGDGTLDDVFVVTTGGIGTTAPVSVSQTGRIITFRFRNHPCTGSAPNRGESTYFVGLTAQQPAASVAATIVGLARTPITVQAKAPIPSPPPRPSMRR